MDCILLSVGANLSGHFTCKTFLPACTLRDIPPLRPVVASLNFPRHVHSQCQLGCWATVSSIGKASRDSLISRASYYGTTSLFDPAATCYALPTIARPSSHILRSVWLRAWRLVVDINIVRCEVVIPFMYLGKRGMEYYCRVCTSFVWYGEHSTPNARLMLSSTL